ncbi:LacI family transcriptional regulator [Spirosoma lacussanchae]|uniref:LacI family DNA-binding transcriptional regulator n=1 Tax=Spirosoma lacussanchae TaxID=1884249 RepID=UPI001107B4EF|nr:LacI family DNA-binding transcriptional regulator [Spirosoma lacussanchae]
MPRLDRSRRTNVTIVDIAEKLQISSSTVSRALRNHPDIRPETVEAVKNMAKKLNYQPNTQAQSLRERRTRLLGVLVPEIQQFFYSSVLNGIEEVAFRKGYQVVVCKSGETYEREMLQASAMGNQVDGMIVCLSQQTRKTEHFRQLKQQGMPLVFFDRAPERFTAHKVVFDNEAHTFLLTEHLLKSGFNRIALLTGPPHLISCQEQIRGYEKALDRYRKGDDTARVQTVGFGYQDGCVGFQKLMKQPAPPDAILAGSDQLAFATLLEARSIKLNIPSQLGLAVCGGDPFHARFENAVTSLTAKGFEMGSRAAYLCIQDIENTDKATKARTERITSDIVIRHSSVRPQGGEYATGDYSRHISTHEPGADEVHIY